MKEREQVELTTKPVNPTLSKEGDVFMPEPGGGDIPRGPEESKSSKPQSEKKPDIRGAVIREGLRRSVFGKEPKEEKPQEVQERSRKAWDEFYKGKKMLPGEKGVVEAIIKEGGVPKGWVDKEAPIAKDVPKEGGVNVEEVSVSEAPEPFVSGDKNEKAREKEFVPGDLDGFKRYFKETLPDATEEQIESIAKGALENVKKREAGELPNSFEELVALIMKYQEVEWKPGGEHELIDKEGRVVKENFIAWVRKRMVDLHEFNPTSQVNFFSDINVKAGYSVISFYDMIFTGSYFLEKKYQPNADVSEDGKVRLDTDTELFQNEDYKAMKDQLITEAFLFQNSRNNHITYLQTMHDEKELPKLLQQIYYANPFTRGKYLERVLTMPSMDRGKIEQLKAELGIEEVRDGDSDEIKKEKERKIGEFQDKKIDNLIKNESEVGEGVREALLAYYYINDFEMLKEVLGEDSVFFEERYLEYDSETGKPAKDKDGNPKVGIIGKANDEKKEKGKRDKVNYDEKTGKLIKNEANIVNFTKYVNVFNDATKDERIVSEVRERIRQSLVNRLGINYAEAKYAEAWAYSMTRWTGIAARNDVNAVGYDAWSKTQNFMEYRLKQMEEKRAGVVGNIYNMLGIKKTSLSFLEGVTDVHGRTVIEAIQGHQGSRIEHRNPFKKHKTEAKNNEESRLEAEKDKEPLGLEFSQDVSQRFAANHIYNAFGIYDFIINHKEFHLEDMVTTDAMGRPIIDQAKANEIIDGIQKQIRYAYSTWGGTDYSKNIRVYETKRKEVKDEKTGKLKEKKFITSVEKPIIAAMFGPEILRFINEDLDRKGIERDSDKPANIYRVGEGKDSFEIDVARIQSDDNKEREILWKHVMKYLIGQEIKSHRTIQSDLSRYSYATTQRIYTFLRSKGIVTEHDVKDMRKLSNTSEKRMFSEEFALEFGHGATKGIWEAFKFFAANLAR